MPCQVAIESLQATTPYRNGNEPAVLTAVGRSSIDCQQVRIIVSVAGPGTAVIADRTVTVDFSNTQGLPAGTLPGLVSLEMPLPPQGGLRCGDRLHVEMACAQHPSTCRDERFLDILCKPNPGTPGQPGTPGDPGAPGNPGNGAIDPGGWWPEVRCMFTASSAAFALIAAMACIAIGVATQNTTLLAMAAILLAGAGLAWSLWSHFCAPNLCTREGVLCWVCKRAFLAAIPVFPFMTNFTFILVFIAYGALAGILVDRLRGMGCYVPSARLPLTQMPI